VSVLGTRVKRKEDPKFLTIGGTYTADVRDARLDGAVHATFVRSTMAHAKLLEVDVDEARSAPGVVDVLTHADLAEFAPPKSGMPGFIPDEMARPWLAGDTVRFVGEPIAVILTDEPYRGEDAAELVIVDYEPLPAVTDAEVALTDEVLLFPAAGTNVALDVPGKDHVDVEGCEVVVHQRIVNQRLAACPLEVRSAAATWHNGRLLLWISNQAPHGVRGNLADLYGLQTPEVHVIAPDVGGGFGAKINASAEECILPFISKRLGRPVRWVETRSENMVGMPHGRGQTNTVTLGGRRDGTIEAYRLSVLADAGAYPAMGALLTFMTRMMTSGVYAIPHLRCDSKAVATNTTVVEAYRGAGRPEATHAIERAVDIFAAEIGMDPAEVRRKNFIPADAFPHTTAVGTTYDTGDYESALDAALQAAGYAELRAEQARRRDAGDPVQLGIGLCCYVEITAGPGPGQEEYARVEVGTDGRATVYTGSSSHGQGHVTSWAMIASDLTGIALDEIDVVHSDTDVVPEGSGTFGSRSLQIGGAAVHQATEALVDRAKGVAGELLEVATADIDLDTSRGVFTVAGVPTMTKTWGEIAAAAPAMLASGMDPAAGLSEQVMFTTTSPTFPFGAHVAVVEVDTETGQVQLVRFVSCDDAGRILNPVVVEGQRHGGIAQGVAQALLEEVRYDDDGNPLTSNLADYGMISAAELPSFELVPLETPTPANPLGAKGIGESGTIGATPSVHNAVVDAVSHLGVRHIDLPLSPERVWRAISEASGSRS
jgi:carbon-monoxide dehydrogenase large subunit